MVDAADLKSFYHNNLTKSLSNINRLKELTFSYYTYTCLAHFLKCSTPGHTFKEAAKKFIAEYELSVARQRNERYAKSHESRINNHLIPFFGDKPLNEITAGLVQEYRIERTQKGFKGRYPSRSTLHTTKQ